MTNKTEEVGLIEGDLCCRDGCQGIMERHDEPNCSCHISPPCGNCVNAEYQCSECEFLVERP